MIRTMALIALAFALAAGCMRIEAVTLKHPATGHMVTCGPYGGMSQIQFAATVIIQRGCIRDFKEQGYVRVP